jgi:cellulose synthase/poly-beta-1,6-N-acetylglucosamine synthase-like glycosyltransferase
MERAEPGASARALDAATRALERLTPDYSARRRMTFVQGGLSAAFVFLLAAGFKAAPALMLRAIEGAAFVFFAALTAFRLAAAAASLAPPEPAPAKRWTGPLPIYTILCPLYREARVLPDLAARLARLAYPAEKLDVKIVLEADDTDTIAAANAIAWPAHVELIVVPPGRPRTKPKALNYALAFARGAFVTVYDAEDAPHPGQLRAALDAFAAGGEDLGCVQAPLLFDNGAASWLTGQFAAEYAVQFGEVLPLLARLGLPLMLGGTSNHFRAHALTSAGGWDPFNVTEDADIGYRLAREGWRLGVIAPPTWEEAPAKLGAWLRQRTRWIKGHIQSWLVLMRDPGRTLRELGLAGFAAMQLILGGAVLASLLHGPLLALLAFAALRTPVWLGWPSWALAICGYVVAIYNILAAAAATRNWRMALTALTMPLYWPLLTLAALTAIFELVFRPHYWAKTEHGLTQRGARDEFAAWKT